MMLLIINRSWKALCARRLKCDQVALCRRLTSTLVQNPIKCDQVALCRRMTSTLVQNPIQTENHGFTSSKKSTNIFQSTEGAENYRLASAKIQQQIFELLLKKIDIKPGWKVLDLGCGTGNGTRILSELVGDKGRIVGLDPIAERIVQAKKYNPADNIEYYTAFGRDACQYGENEFDVVVAGTVMHWLTPEEKKQTFRSVYRALKPNGGTFLFNIMKKWNSVNTMNFLDLFEDKNIKAKIFKAIFCPEKSAFHELAKNTGFTKATINEEIIAIPFESLDHVKHWFFLLITRCWVPDVIWRADSHL